MAIVVKARDKTIKLNIGLVVIFIFLLVMSFVKPDDYSDTMVRALGILTVATYCVVIWTWYTHTKKIGSMYFIFLLMCFMFNAGQIILGAFDISFVGIVNIYNSYNNKLLAEMMLFQSKCVLALGIGGCLAYRERAYDFSDFHLLQHNENKNEANKFGLLEVAYLIVFVLTMLVYLREFFTRSGVSYGQYYHGEREGVSIQLLFIYHVLLYVAFMRHGKDHFSRWLLGSNLVLILVMLMIGSRSVILQIVFGCLFINTYIKKNRVEIPFIKVVAYVLIGLVVIVFFSGLQELRQVSFSAISLSKIAEIYSSSFVDGIVGSFVQTGGTARCILQTMAEIQSGAASTEQTFIYAFAKGLVPIDILSAVGINAPNNSSLATWITEAGGSYSGWGYSIFAEMYYNFQEWGWIFGIIFAFAYVKLEQKALNLVKEGRVFFAGGLIYVLSYAVYLSRSDMALISSRMRFCVYLALISFVMKQHGIRFKLKN